MNKALPKNLELVARPVLHVPTRVSMYDRVSGGLAAGVLVSGVVMGLLIAVWLAQLAQTRTIPDGLVMFSTETASQEEVAGDVDEPLTEELLDVQSLELVDAVQRVDIISAVSANDGDSRDRRGGVGDSRVPYPATPDRIPIQMPVQRWQIVFAVDTLAGYSSLLDDLGVELAGVERGGQLVVYMKNFVGEPAVRVGEKLSEKRIYFVHSMPQLREWDLSLLSKTGLDRMDQRIPLHFYPVKLINRLYELETERVRQDGKKVSEIKTTTFRVVKTPDGYSLELNEIEYLASPKRGLTLSGESRK
ncbi:MAG: hypothetical protein Q8M16_11880 [Pirellulaceae bacterium]|nr:hypothetical protein [Pirellulaceae bacterium]